MELEKRIYYQALRRPYDDNETVKKRLFIFIYRGRRERGRGFANKNFLYSNLRRDYTGNPTLSFTRYKD
jgi:hypothetical protein